MHGQIAGERFVPRVQSHENADPAVAMDVTGKRFPGAGHEAREPADLDVFFEGRDELRDRVGNRRFTRPGQRASVRAGPAPNLAEGVLGGDPIGQLVGEEAEGFGSGDEVRLAVHFEENRGLARHVCDNEPFGRRASRLARGGGEPLLAKDLARLVETPASFDESLLAFHDADAGLGAELGDLLLRDFHGSFGSVGSR